MKENSEYDYTLDLRNKETNEIVQYLDNYFNLLDFLNGIIIVK